MQAWVTARGQTREAVTQPGRRLARAGSDGMERRDQHAGKI